VMYVMTNFNFPILYQSSFLAIVAKKFLWSVAAI